MKKSEKTVCNHCEIKSRAVRTLSKAEVDFLSDNCAELGIEAGEYIIREGAETTHVAYVKSGLVKIHKKGPNGKDQILKISGPGRYTGLLSILHGRGSHYSASALTQCNICYIDAHSFRELIRRNPGFTYELIIYLCEDEQTYFERFVNQAQKQVMGRLADSLLYFSSLFDGSQEYYLPLSRQDLAALIGTSRESVARGMKEMAESGLIQIKGKRVKILNQALLQKISING